MRRSERLNKLTVGNIFGTSRNAGIATISSGTTVASVAAAGVKSGSVIMTTPYMYGSVRTGIASGASVTTAPALIQTQVMSVRAGAFEIVTVGSLAPNAAMPVAWTIMGQAS